MTTDEPALRRVYPAVEGREGPARIVLSAAQTVTLAQRLLAVLDEM